MSTTEELAQMLYDKALGELDTYLENMKTKPPQEIMGNAYQIVNKQDLLMILEDAEFTPAELNVLNELDHPLQVLYEEWLPVEDRHMEELRDSVQSYLDTRLQYRAERLYADPAVPRYEGSYMEARETGEVHLYRASRKRDPFSEFHTNAHPCLVNYAYELLMEQERDKKKSAPKRNEPER